MVKNDEIQEKIKILEKEREMCIAAYNDFQSKYKRGEDPDMPQNKERVSVQKSIKRALDKIAQEAQELKPYLNKHTIVTGNTCQYTEDPSKSINWIFSSPK
jgi:uncharacterized protein involved in tolerance to divalent cations